MKKLLLTVCFIIPLHALASPVDTEMELLKEKSGVCLESLKESGCEETQSCKDMESFSNYVFKDSVTSYVNYHSDTGGINNGNFDLVTEAIGANIKALKLMTNPSQCPF